MTAAERAFLAAIRERPADDLPRLVYADWLDERGEAGRAEFIRVQCAIAAAGPAPATAEEYAAALAGMTPPAPPHLAARKAATLGAMAGWVKEQVPAGCDLVYRRGLPFALRGEGPAVLQHAPAVLPVFPVVGLLVRQLPAVAQRLSDLPCVDRIEVLAGGDEYDTLGANVLRAVAWGRHWTRLHTIKLCAYQLTTAGVVALAASPVARQLERLKLCCNPRIGDEGIVALATAVNPERFRELDFEDTGVTDAGLIAFVRSAGTANVERLNLMGGIGNPGLTALAAARYDRLDDLVLSGWRVGDVSEGLHALADASFRPRKLALFYDDASEAALLALCRSDVVSRVEQLEVSVRPHQTRAIAALVSSPKLGRLKRLSINGFAADDPWQDSAAVGDGVAIRVANEFALPALEELCVACGCGDGGAVALLASQRLPRALTCRLRCNGRDRSDGVRAAFRERFGPGSAS